MNSSYKNAQVGYTSRAGPRWWLKVCYGLGLNLHSFVFLLRLNTLHLYIAKNAVFRVQAYKWGREWPKPKDRTLFSFNRGNMYRAVLGLNVNICCVGIIPRASSDTNWFINQNHNSAEVSTVVFILGAGSASILVDMSHI